MAIRDACQHVAQEGPLAPGVLSASTSSRAFSASTRVRSASSAAHFLVQKGVASRRRDLDQQRIQQMQVGGV